MRRRHPTAAFAAALLLLCGPHLVGAPAVGNTAERACQEGACLSREGRRGLEAEAAVRILEPREGSALTLAGAGTSGHIQVEAHGIFAKVALYLDGQFVSATPWPAGAAHAALEVALPGAPTTCGRWHYVEVALIDADDYRLENLEAEAVVRFTSGCSRAHAHAAAAARRATGAQEERERAAVFERIYQTFAWEPSADGSRETRSGPGSYLARTNASRAFLGDVLARFQIRRMLDAGCGDVNWQIHTPGLEAVEYVGVDIVPEMIADNARRLSGSGWGNMRFETKDVVHEDLGAGYDLVLCRDTLFHLPLWDAVQALRNMQATGATYLVSHYDEDLATNWPDISVGGWHMINLLAGPFKLPEPILSVPEAGNEGDTTAAAHYGHSRRIGLWRFPVLPPIWDQDQSSTPAPPPGAQTLTPPPASGAPHHAPHKVGEAVGGQEWGWVEEEGMHGSKRCVIVAPEGQAQEESWLRGDILRRPGAEGSDARWWPVDLVFVVARGGGGGGQWVGGSEAQALYRVPAKGVNRVVDDALDTVAGTLGLHTPQAPGGGNGWRGGDERARALLATVWVGCRPLLLVGEWGGVLGGEGRVQVGGSVPDTKDEGAAAVVASMRRSGMLVLYVAASDDERHRYSLLRSSRDSGGGGGTGSDAVQVVLAQNVWAPVADDLSAVAPHSGPGRAAKGDGEQERGGAEGGEQGRGGRAVCVIPARLGSKRFPAKLLQDLAGQSVLRRTYMRARQARACDDVVIATESDEVVAHVEGWQARARVLKTSPHWTSGTERVYEAWRLLTLSETHDPGGGQIEWIINVQGDEPLLEPAHVDRLAELMKAERSRRMGTLRCVSQDAIKS